MFVEEQIRIPCVIMRGGTSKAVFLKEKDFPNDELRDQIILSLFGSPDVRQIDGLGGADILTSKCAIIGPPSKPDVHHVDYTFAQVGIKDPIVSYDMNCGNISSAVAVYAIEEGYVKPVDPVTRVRIFNTNTKSVIVAHVPIKNNLPAVEGNCRIDGVPGTGAEIKLDYCETQGAVTGKLLPTGKVKEKIYISSLQMEIEISIVDLANPCVFFRAGDIGMRGTEKSEDFTNEQLDIFEEIRIVAAQKIGLQNTLLLPYPVMVSKPMDYTAFSTGRTFSSKEYDLSVRMVGFKSVHKAFPITGGCCTAVAALIEGTIVYEMRNIVENPNQVLIGHPSGLLPVSAKVEKENRGWAVKEVAVARTARRIMEGYAFIRRSLL